jgi:hypothetical protein
MYEKNRASIWQGQRLLYEEYDHPAKSLRNSIDIAEWDRNELTLLIETALWMKTAAPQVGSRIVFTLRESVIKKY